MIKNAKFSSCLDLFLYGMYRHLLYICYKNTEFLHPWYMHLPFITPYPHPLSQPFWNIPVFLMPITLRFFHLDAYKTNVMKGDKIRCDVIFNLYAYNLFPK